MNPHAFIRVDIAALRSASRGAGYEHPPHWYEDIADDRLLAHAAAAMREKLTLARQRGRGGWWKEDECTIPHLRALLTEHLEKGDMRDVMCLAAMVYVRQIADTPAEDSAQIAPPIKSIKPKSFDLIAHLRRQRAFSESTFGPGGRAKGVIDHIRKELREIAADPTDVTEWIDVIILALDGAWRTGSTPEQIVEALADKQAKNESRTWPDWRTADPEKAIEHDREPDPWEDLVERWLTGLTPGERAYPPGLAERFQKWVTTTEVLVYAIGAHADASGRAEQMRVQQIMKRLGWRHERIRTPAGRRERRWISPLYIHSLNTTTATVTTSQSNQETHQ